MKNIEKPRILFVSEEGSFVRRPLEKKIGCTIEHEYLAKVAAIKAAYVKYDAIIIDASDDTIVDGHHCLSEYIRNKNSNIIIIGISVMGMYFSKDGLSNKLYDKKISIDSDKIEDDAIKIRTVLEEYGFEFSEEVIEK